MITNYVEIKEMSKENMANLLMDFLSSQGCSDCPIKKYCDEDGHCEGKILNWLDEISLLKQFNELEYGAKFEWSIGTVFMKIAPFEVKDKYGYTEKVNAIRVCDGYLVEVPSNELIREIKE